MRRDYYRPSARANVLPHHDVWFTKLTTSMATTDRPTHRGARASRLRAPSLLSSSFHIPAPRRLASSVCLYPSLSVISRPMDPSPSALPLRRCCRHCRRPCATTGDVCLSRAQNATSSTARTSRRNKS